MVTMDLLAYPLARVATPRVHNLFRSHLGCMVDILHRLWRLKTPITLLLTLCLRTPILLPLWHRIHSIQLSLTLFLLYSRSHLFLEVCECACMCVCMCVCIRVLVHVCLYVRVHVCKADDPEWTSLYSSNLRFQGYQYSSDCSYMST